MTYLVIELQTTDGTTSHIVSQYDNLPAAEQKFYQILSFAVVSEVPIHTALIIDEAGNLIKNESFRHISPEPEPEPNTEE